MFQRIERRTVGKDLGWWEEIMEPVVNRELRQLCKAVSEEQEPGRLRALLDQLVQVLDERMLLASLF